MKIPADTRMDSTDELRKQAWAWLRLLNSGNVKSWDVEGFKRWLQISPAHRNAFNEAKRHWSTFRPVASGVLSRSLEARAYHERTSYGCLQSRRAFLGAAVGVAAVAGLAVMNSPVPLWSSPSEWGADYRTATGEQREVDLSDRIKVTLNTQTSIRRELEGARTVGIHLLTGEAAIDLAISPANSESFVVLAGVGRSIADAARFEVRHLDDKVCVTCVEGTVRIEHALGTRTITAKQQAIYDDRGLSGVGIVDPKQASAWRKGELVFNNTRLADAIAEINRYRPGRVVLMNESVRNKPVSGSFYIASLDDALALLQRTFDLRARTLPGGLMMLS